MPASPTEWNERHRTAGEVSALEAAPLVRELLPLLPTGPALDLACGRGRHTLLLAERAQAVTAVDWSTVALDILERAALARRLKFRRAPSWEEGLLASAGGILAEVRDLQQLALPAGAFALILCVQYLDRRLLHSLGRALQPGGMVLFETYTTAQLAVEGGPRNRAYLLEPGELRESLAGLEIIFYRELNAGQGIASLLARRPATGE